MAMQFVDNGAQRLEIPTHTTIDNQSTFSICCWVRPTSTSHTTTNAICRKGAQKVLRWAPSDLLRINLNVDRATTDADGKTSTQLSANTWYFIAGTYSEANGPHLYLGTQTAVVALDETASPTVGSGATVTDATQILTVGGRASGVGGWNGDIAHFHFIAGVELTLAQIRDQQFRPHPRSGTKVYMQLGWQGATNVTDWSGAKAAGNSGSIAGGSVNVMPHPGRFRARNPGGSFGPIGREVVRAFGEVQARSWGSGAANGRGVLSASAFARADGSGAPASRGVLSGSSHVLADGLGLGAGRGVLAASSMVLSDGTGVPMGRASLAGSSHVLADGSGSVAGRGSLNGSSRGLAHGSGAPAGRGVLGGRADVLACGFGEPLGRAAVQGEGRILTSSSSGIVGMCPVVGSSLVFVRGTATPLGRGTLVGDIRVRIESSGQPLGRLSAVGSSFVDVTSDGLLLFIPSGAIFGSAMILGHSSGSIMGRALGVGSSIEIAHSIGGVTGRASIIGSSIVGARGRFSPFVDGTIYGTSFVTVRVRSKLISWVRRVRGAGITLAYAQSAILLPQQEEDCPWDAMAGDAIHRNLELQGEELTFVPRGISADAVTIRGIFRQDYELVDVSGNRVIMKSPNFAVGALPVAPMAHVDQVVTMRGDIYRVVEVRWRGAGVDLICRRSRDIGEPPPGDEGDLD